MEIQLNDDNIDGIWTFYNWLFCYTAFILPVLIYASLRTRRIRRDVRVHLPLWMIWILLNAINFRTFPVRYVYIQKLGGPGADLYDGIASNALFMGFGWVFPLAAIGIYRTVSLCIRRVRTGHWSDF